MHRSPLNWRINSIGSQPWWSRLLTVVAAASSLLSQAVTTQAPAGTAHVQRESASLHIFGPGVLAVDASGNVYAAAPDGVFKIDPSGGRTRIAGIERDRHYSGDGGLAIQAGLNSHGMAMDAGGNLYLADAGNHRIRKLALATGVITTVAGVGVKGFSGDAGPAINAQLDSPTGVAVDTKGDLYISDGTNRIRKVAAATGVITTVAGNGSQGDSGDGGPATLARFRSLGGLATDASGNLYVADNFNNRIRMVSAATGIVTTVAGNGVAGFAGDSGPATNAELNNPLSVAVDGAGNIFIADSGNFRIRKVNAATGTITTVGNGGVVYRDTQHGFPCALAFDGRGDLYIADWGVGRIRKVPAGSTGADAPFAPLVQSFASSSGFKINVTYDPSVSSTAQAAFKSVINTYQNIFTSNVTVNLYVTFGVTGLGESLTEQQYFSYSAWRAAMIANANANPGNIYAAAAAASLPSSDPIGNRTVVLNTANARALGLNASTSVDSTITFSNTAVFEYTGVASSGASDFLDTAAHELDEALGIGSTLTGLTDNSAVPTGNFAAEDYFRYSAAGTRAITTNPNAVVYFSYNGGSTNVAQFNQSYSAQGDTDLDRNDWIYGNFGCPEATVYVQDAIACEGQAVAIGSGPEITVLSALGYDSSFSQTITFPAISNVTFGVAPFTIGATASSGLAVSFTSTKLAVCTVSGSTVTIVGAGTCSITANQPGNATYSAAPAVSRSFTVSQAAQTISFGTLSNVNLGVAPFSIAATATSGLAVTFASATTGVCTVAGSVVTIIVTGSCSIIASQGGNANYTAATPVTQTFLVGPACTVSLTSTSFTAIATGGNSAVGLTASSGTCSWTASSNASWLTITAGFSGSGGGTVSYSIATDPGAPRLGTLTIGGHTFTVNEFGAYPILDFNADGKQDVFLYDPVNGGAYAGLSNSSGGFTYVFDFFSPGFDTIRFGNLAAGGFSSLVAYNSTTATGYALLGSGTGTFSSAVSMFWGPGFTKVAAGDLNGDGLTDFVMYRPTDGTSYTAISNGDGTFRYQYALLSGGFTHLVVADFNGDGKADVLFYRSTDGFASLGIGNGTGGFTFSTVPLSAGYTFVEAGDINGDGMADVLFYSGTSGAAAVGLSTGSGFTFTPYLYSPGFTTVKLFDFNGDGKADVALYNMNTAIGYLGISNGTSAFTYSSLFWGPGFSIVDALDLNGDGKIDIVIYNTSNAAAYTAISSGNPANPFTYQYSFWGTGKVLATATAQP
jgi:sugar lactone lactonase YvrE